MSERTDTPELARPASSAFEERLRGWMASSERRFEANQAAGGDVLELSMLDIVGEDAWTGGGITSKAVQAKLEASPKAKIIKVLMNSPGGDAFEGLAIQSLLKRHGARVEVEVVGLAASAASIIAMAGDSIAMHEGALMMIHAPWSFAMGDAAEMRTTAAFLDKVNASALDVYTRRTGRARDEIAALVADETWMTASEAVDAKFATSVITGTAPAKTGKARAAAQIFMSARRPQSSGARQALSSSYEMGEMPEVGDRVQVVVTPHDPKHKTGLVRQVVCGAIGIEFDSMPGEVYHWYVASEVAVIDPKPEPDDGGGMQSSARKPAPRALIGGDGPADMQARAAVAEHANTRSPATPALPPVAETAGSTPEGNNNMKTISLAAVAAALGMSAVQLEAAEEKDVLDAVGTLRKRADSTAPTAVQVSGVKLLGVATEAEATTKIQSFQRAIMQLLGTTAKASPEEAMAVVLEWKSSSDQLGDSTRKVAQLTEETRVAKRDAAIEKMSAEGTLPPARHEWARSQFPTAEAVETFCKGMPRGFFSSIRNEITEAEDASAVKLSAEEKRICQLVGVTEQNFLEQKKLDIQARNARIGS